MSIFYSAGEVVALAVETERTGAAMYDEAVRRATNERLKELFKFLADEERKHIATFQSLYKLVQEGPETSPFDWEEVGRYLKVISDSHFFAGSDKALNLIRQAVSPLAALDLALSFEKETMLFYYGITQVVRPKERGVVEEIIAQEQNHILCLSKLKDELKGGDLAEA